MRVNRGGFGVVIHKFFGVMFGSERLALVRTRYDFFAVNGHDPFVSAILLYRVKFLHFMCLLSSVLVWIRGAFYSDNTLLSVRVIDER